MDPIQFAERIVFPTMLHYPNWFLFATRRQCILTELGMMTLSVHTNVLWWRQILILQTYSTNLPLLPQRRDQLQKHPQLRHLGAKSYPLRCACGHPRLARSRGYSSRVASLDSCGVRFDVVRDLLVLFNHRSTNASCNFLIPNSVEC